MKEKRRSLLGLLAPQRSNKASVIENGLKSERDLHQNLKLKEDHLSFQAFPFNSSKRVSDQKHALLLRHKVVKSLDLSFAQLRSQSPPRPASSLGITTVDTRTIAPQKIGLAIDEEDNHPGTLLELEDVEMVLRHKISETDVKMSSPRRVTSNQSQSNCTTSTANVDRSPTKGRREGLKPKDGKNRWVSQVKDWFSTGEPSSHDWKQLKKQEFQRCGVAMDDPDASAKLHAPIGAIPEEAIKPSSGPDPEALAKKRAEQRRLMRQTYGVRDRMSGSISSGSSSSSREVNPIAPWE